MTTVNVNLGDRTYPIEIGRGTIERLPGQLRELGAASAVAIVTDTNVAPLYADHVAAMLGGAGYTPFVCVMPAGEEHKRLERIEDFTGQFLKAGLDRSSVIIALGGGVVGDVAGFAAASFMRGLRYIQVPTTIVAQVDSSVGGKTGVNHPLGKNVIGAFHQPSAVLIDMDLLHTLPKRELQAGLAEVIKHGVIADAKLFAYMEDNAGVILECDVDALEYPIRRSCEIKAAIVATDEREQGLRANLNYGHTFGHAIESVTDYKQFLHGEAIALGMCAAGALAHDLGMVDAAFVRRQQVCIEGYRLPVPWPQIPVTATLSLMKHDKKVRSGKLKFILADRLGHVVQRDDVPVERVQQALEVLRK
ncbi:MAG: 3-dehydroquinate synthase [Candidatus Hydrogenedentales bacterium]